MAEAIHILLIDDEPNDSTFVQAFQARARDFGMKVKHCDRGKKGLDELTANPYKYKAVILDARCIWDETGGFANDKFLSRMVVELERLEKELNLAFPTVVNTAFMENFQEDRQMMLKRGGEIFHKSSNNEEEEKRIFNFIKTRIENSDEWKYRDVLSLFDKTYLPEQLRPDLISILRKLHDAANVKRNFTELRKFIEAMYEAINEKSPGLIPSAVFIGRGGRGVNLDWTWRYLSGLPVNIRNNGSETSYQNAAVFPPHVAKCVKACEEMSSNITHLYPEDVSIYGYRCATFALLETLMWFGEFMDN